MAIVSLAPAGAVGIIKDVQPAELPAQAWSDGRNIRFADGAVHSCLDTSVMFAGTTEQFTSALPAPVTAVGLASWVLGSATKLYCLIQETLTDITRVSGQYNGTSTTRWSGATLGGVSVLNNPNDLPQVWGAPSALTKMIDLPNWPSTYRAQAIRSYKQYLVALDIQKDANRYPTLVKWSHPADPGAVPSSWDETDPTKDAGEYPLSETPGYVMDCCTLRDTNIVYKTDSVWGMQYVGGTYIFRFYKIFGDFGVPNRDCVVEHVAGTHFVFTGTDLIVHDGQNAKSVATHKVKSMLKSFSVNQLRTSFVVSNPNTKEVMCCFRLANDNLFAADTAIVYNWADDTISIRDLNNLRFAACGRIDPPLTGVITWDTVTGTWESYTGDWGEAFSVPAIMRILGLGDHNVQQLDTVPVSSVRSWLEKTYLGVPMRANQAPDLSAQKFVRRIWPRFTGRTGDVVTITLGAANSVSESIQWKDPQQYIIGTSKHLDCTLTGKTFAIRMETVNASQWSFHGMDADVIIRGVR